ncbi:ACP S-malonyltransferase [Thermopetrobacter sp. TC1]|uniref:ACP S-malonyltransferase n=1 Tax=Thermopetrobacter sp. TC1 TaxID=1495045 RepID=UPI00056DC24D|nr:ACP S-malonyltransferase [Thermopetrobacter sp. TC1]
MATAFIFPGQGSQKVGMGKELAENFASARAVFEEVDDALGRPLSKIIFEGPEEELTLTENAQPALMAVSMAVVRVLENDFGVKIADHARYLAGHSLGEYSALCAAGAFTLDRTAKLLQTRGRAMQGAVPVGEGGMAAILGLDLGEVEAVAKKAAGGEVCEVANDNAPGQVVVSGHIGAVERACIIARDAGAKRTVMLPVSAPFHCSLMQKAAEAMAWALGEASEMPATVPVVANVTAAPESTPAEIVDNLVRQVTGRVRWRESMAFMAGEGVDLFVELGAGRVLTGLVKRNAPNAEGMAVGTPADIEKLAERLKG